MGKATAPRKSQRIRRASVPQAVRAADIPPAQLASGTFEEAAVPNPHGEVEVAGRLRPHLVARRVPAIVTLHRRRVIDRGTLAALEWYADRLEAAQMGLVRCALGNIGGRGGGAASSHVPVTDAMMQAAGDVAWARDAICAGDHPAQRLRAFDAVLVGEETFAETARRERAARYVRKSVSRRQRELRDLFLAAAKDLAVAWHQRFGPRTGVVRSAEWSHPEIEAAWPEVYAALYGSDGK